MLGKHTFAFSKGTFSFLKTHFPFQILKFPLLMVQVTALEETRSRVEGAAEEEPQTKNRGGQVRSFSARGRKPDGEERGACPHANSH